MKYFFYGTLLDPKVLASVLGRRIPPAYCEAAVLPGHRTVCRRGATYPVLVADAAAMTAGRLVSRLSAADARRLAVFEGSGYGCVVVDVALAGRGSAAARAFLPRAAILASNRPWRLAEWRRRQRVRFIRRLQTGAPAPRV
jgi:hypothetical protein